MSFLHSFLAVTGQTDAWSAEISAGAVFARQHRQRIDQQHQNHQNDSDGKGDVGLTALARVDVQRNGQGGGGGLQRGKEVVDHHAEAGGEQQCGGFAHERPTARMQPVTMPSTAPGSTTVRTIRHLPAPSASAPSR